MRYGVNFIIQITHIHHSMILLLSTSKTHGGPIVRNYPMSMLYFRFRTTVLSGVGFVISYESNNAGLDLCLKVIAEKGFLSIEDYLNLTI